MARTATASWEAIQEIVRDYLDKPSTTGEIAKWAESEAALVLGVQISSPTVYRLLKDTTTAGIYGLSQVGREKRWVYSDKTIEKTKKEFTKAATVTSARIIEAEADKEAARVVSLTKALSESSIEDLIKNVDELTLQKRAFAKDDIEQQLLLGLRAAVDKFQGGYEQHVKAWEVATLTDKAWITFANMIPDLLDKGRSDALPIIAARFVAATLVESEESE